MKEKVANEKTVTKKWAYIVFAVLVVVQLASIIYYFQEGKEGYHSDEVWSYGYANSYYNKDIHLDENYATTNMDAWYDAQFLEDYIVVNEGEEFEYGSIYSNQITDLSPPLHSMILHTICSFFPGQFSRWFSFSINIVAFIICMIFLFKTAKLLKGDVFALCCCALYGFSLGARDTYVYLRMYALCTALIMVIVYHILKYFEKNKEQNRLLNYHLLIVCIVSLTGFLTHYYMVSLMGILTFLICACLFLKRKWKLMLTYGFSMLATFGISVAMFPSMFRMTEINVEGVAELMDYNFEMRFRILSHFIMKKLFNITVPIASSGILRIVIGCLVFALIVSIPLIVLLRNSKGVQRVLRMIKISFKKPLSVLRYLERRINWFYIILFVSIIGEIIVTGETTKVYSMGFAVDRYLFYLYPLVVIIGIALVYQLGMLILKKRKISQGILLGLTLILVGINVYNCTKYTDYLFLRKGDVQIEDVIAGQNCIFVRVNPWMLTTMTPTLMYADEIAQIQYEDYEKIVDLYNEKADDGPVMIVVDASFTASIASTLNSTNFLEEIDDPEGEKRLKLYQDMIALMEELDPDTEMEHLTSQMIFGRPMQVYLINP